MAKALALGALLAQGGCIGGRGHPVGDKPGGAVDAELAALMVDGPLPAAMKPPPTMPEPPRRFCDSFPFPGSGGMGAPFPEDGGVAFAGGGAPLPVAGKGSTTPSFAGTGMPAAGSGGSVPQPVTGGVGGSRPFPISGAGGSFPTAGGPSGGFGGGGAPGESGCASQPIGFWTFNDCNTARTELFDSSSESHTAFRTVDLACTSGQENQGVMFATNEDMVYAPDQPAFALNKGVTVAAWVKPDSVSGTRTLFRKRDDDNSAIALLINGNKFQFVVRLSSGKLVSVSAPASARRWTHVAGTYDNTTLRLYVDGKDVSHTRAPGVIARGVGPLLIGNDAAGRRFQGTIDNAWFNTLAAPESKIRDLNCVRRNPQVTVSPLVGPAVDPGQLVNFTLSITNRNPELCLSQDFEAFASPPSDFTVEQGFSIFTLPSGATHTLTMGVASGEETEPGTYPVGFQVFTLSSGTKGFPLATGSAGSSAGFGTAPSMAATPTSKRAPIAPPNGMTGSGSAGSGAAGMGGGEGGSTGFVSVEAQFVVKEPTGCHVTASRELFVRDLSVVDDPVRTNLVAGDGNSGAWSFGRLMERLSPKPSDAPAVTEAMFRTFLEQQTVNGFTIPVRPPMEDTVLAPWPRTEDGKLDLTRAPMRLLAIVNRLDLKDLSKHKAGEGRFVFGVLGPFGDPLEFTLIFEYALPADTEAEARAWADTVHALQALPFPSEAYNQALQAITDRFSAENAVPSLPNGSALIDIRTNEISLSLEGIWQLREFHISASTGFMEPAPLFQTPDRSFEGSERLARFINENEAAILSETHEAPTLFEGEPFQAAAIFNTIDRWSAPGINNPEARHKFSLNTCNGCHGAEAGVGFLQVQPRFPGQVSFLSGFLTGTTVFDFESGVERRLAELRRRRLLLESVVCAAK